MTNCHFYITTSALSSTQLTILIHISECYSFKLATITMQAKHRPTGVTIIAILTIIEGILLLLAGISLVVIGGFISTSTTSSTSHTISQFLGVIAAAIGGVLLVIGIGYLVMFYGLLKGKTWAWTITVILLLIGIAIQIISMAIGGTLTASAGNGTSTDQYLSEIIGTIVGLAINIIMLYYLYRPHVKAFFGKAAPPSTPPLS